jgi:hypothetical protein
MKIASYEYAVDRFHLFIYVQLFGSFTQLDHYISGLLQCDFCTAGLLFAYPRKSGSLGFRKTTLASTILTPAESKFLKPSSVAIASSHLLQLFLMFSYFVKENHV